MAKSRETFNKKEKEKKKIKKKRDKEQKKEDRRANYDPNKSFDDMIAYVDQFGNITDTPPDLNDRVEVNLEDIQLGAAKNIEPEFDDSMRQGKVIFFNESKGYGFIKDLSSQESIFVHINNVTGVIKDNDKVAFSVEEGPKGLMAVKVTKM